MNFENSAVQKSNANLLINFFEMQILFLFFIRGSWFTRVTKNDSNLVVHNHSLIVGFNNFKSEFEIKRQQGTKPQAVLALVGPLDNAKTLDDSKNGKYLYFFYIN